jgi:hypothetical protein
MGLFKVIGLIKRREHGRFEAIYGLAVHYVVPATLSIRMLSKVMSGPWHMTNNVL